MKGIKKPVNKKVVSAILAAALLVTSVSVDAVYFNTETVSAEESTEETDDSAVAATDDYEAMKEKLETAQTALTQAETDIAGLTLEGVNDNLAAAQTALDTAAEDEESIDEYLEDDATLEDTVAAAAEAVDEAAEKVAPLVQKVSDAVDVLTELETQANNCTSESEYDEIIAKAEAAFEDECQANDDAMDAVDAYISAADAFATAVSKVDLANDENAQLKAAYESVQKAVEALQALNGAESVDSVSASIARAYDDMVAAQGDRVSAYTGTSATSLQTDAVFGKESTNGSSYWTKANIFFVQYLKDQFKDKEDLTVSSLTTDTTGLDYVSAHNAIATDRHVYGNGFKVTYTENGQTVTRYFNYHIMDNSGNLTVYEKNLIPTVEEVPASAAVYDYVLNGDTSAITVYGGDATDGITVKKNSDADLYAANVALSATNNLQNYINAGATAWVSGTATTTYDIGAVTVPDTYGTKDEYVTSETYTDFNATEEMQEGVKNWLSSHTDGDYHAEVYYTFIVKHHVDISMSNWDAFWMSTGTTLFGWAGVEYTVDYYKTVTDYSKVTGSHQEVGVIATTSATVTTRNYGETSNGGYDNDWGGRWIKYVTRWASDKANAAMWSQIGSLQSQGYTVYAYSVEKEHWYSSTYCYKIKYYKDVPATMTTYTQPYTAKHYVWSETQAAVAHQDEIPAHWTEVKGVSTNVEDYAAVKEILTKLDLADFPTSNFSYAVPTVTTLDAEALKTTIREFQASAYEAYTAIVPQADVTVVVNDSLVYNGKAQEGIVSIWGEAESEDSDVEDDSDADAEDADVEDADVEDDSDVEDADVEDDADDSDIEVNAVDDSDLDDAETKDTESDDSDADDSDDENLVYYFKDGVADGCSIKYFNNIEAGTAYAVITFDEGGMLIKEFEIAKYDAGKALIADIADQYVTGSAILPTISFTDGKLADSASLVEGTDYDVTYASNTEAGTARVTVTFKGNYTGTVTKTFNIVEVPVEQAPVVDQDPVQDQLPVVTPTEPQQPADNNNNNNGQQAANNQPANNANAEQAVEEAAPVEEEAVIDEAAVPMTSGDGQAEEDTEAVDIEDSEVPEAAAEQGINFIWWIILAIIIAVLCATAFVIIRKKTQASAAGKDTKN